MFVTRGYSLTSNKALNVVFPGVSWLYSMHSSPLALSTLGRGYGTISIEAISLNKMYWSTAPDRYQPVFYETEQLARLELEG